MDISNTEFQIEELMTQHLATQNTVFVENAVKGKILVFQEGLSFWGGVDPDTGKIIDSHHPNH